MQKQLQLAMYGNALFGEICPQCEGRVRPNKEISVNDEVRPTKKGKPANAQCVTCGPIRMPFLGYYPEVTA